MKNKHLNVLHQLIIKIIEGSEEEEEEKNWLCDNWNYSTENKYNQQKKKRKKNHQNIQRGLFLIPGSFVQY